jgi:hypothetical protein
MTADAFAGRSPPPSWPTRPAPPSATSRRARAQAVCGIVEADDGHYQVPPEHAEALVDRESPAYLAPLAAMNATGALVMRELLDAFRHGGGIGYERYGAEFRDAQQDLGRPLYRYGIGTWMARCRLSTTGCPPAGG